jgi:tetratricopeptide (TPR) repeat protein
MILVRLGQIYSDMKNYPKAVGIFQEVLEKEPRNSSARISLAVTYDALKQYDAALEVLEKIPPQDPRYFDALTRRGYILGQMDRMEQAQASFAEAVQLKPQEGSLAYYMGLMYLQRKEYPQAVAQLEKAVQDDQNNVQYLYQLGAAQERARMLDRAERTFRKVLALDPKYADAYNYLGYMFADEGIKLEESVALITKALELEPENGAFIDSLGWAYFKLGRTDEALIELQRAVKYTRREDATIREHLGDVYFRKNLLQDALREWEKALTLDDTNTALQQKLEDLRKRVSHNNQ